MPLPCTQWDPYGVLNIDTSSTVCYRWAPSQRRNCRNPISQASRQEAQSALSELAAIDPSSNLGTRLQTLAHHLLCKRNHQNQAGSVVDRWKKKMDRFLRNSREGEAELMRLMEAERARLQGYHRQRSRGNVIAQLSPPGAPRTVCPSSLNSPSVQFPPRPLDGRKRQSGTSLLTSSTTPEVQLSAHRETFNSLSNSSAVDMLFEDLGTSRSEYRQWLEEHGLPESASREVPLSAFREMFDSLDDSGTADMIFEMLGTSRPQIRRGLEEREQAEEVRRPLIRPGSGFQTREEYVNWTPRPPPRRSNNPAVRQAPQRSHGRDASNRHALNSLGLDAGTGNSPRVHPSLATLGSIPVSPITMIHPTIALNPAMLATSGIALTRATVRTGPPANRPSVQQPSTRDSNTSETNLSSDCSICYDELQGGHSLVSCKVQCGQRFHEECMRTWFQTAEKRTCPYW